MVEWIDGAYKNFMFPKNSYAKKKDLISGREDFQLVIFNNTQTT